MPQLVPTTSSQPWISSTGEYSEAHDQGIWQCLCNILQLDPSQAQTMKNITSLLLVSGGLGLRSARRTRVPAHWASWADCLQMIRARHPTVAEQLVRQLEGHPATTCLHEAASAAPSLNGVLGWSPLSWRDLGERPNMRQREEFEPGMPRRSWQHEAASRVEQHFRCSTCCTTSLEPQLFRVLSSIAARIARRVRPDAVVWRGDQNLPPSEPLHAYEVWNLVTN